MKAVFDLRSFLIGAVLVTLVFLVLGAARGDSRQVGRFRIETNEEHVFVVDTVTGQVWEKSVVGGHGARSQDFMDSRLLLHKN